MRRLILAVIGSLAALGAATGQPRTPSVSELLPLMSVGAPSLVRVESKDNSTIRYRIQGAFTVINNSEFDVADIKIQCDWIAPSGARLGNFEITLFSVFAGRGSRNSTAWTGERSPPEQTVDIACGARDLRIVGYRPPPPPPPPVVERPIVDPSFRVTCPLSQCPDRAEIFVTCDCDLKEKLVTWQPNPVYLVPVWPDSPEARRYLGRYPNGY